MISDVIWLVVFKYLTNVSVVLFMYFYIYRLKYRERAGWACWKEASLGLRSLWWWDVTTATVCDLQCTWSLCLYWLNTKVKDLTVFASTGKCCVFFSSRQNLKTQQTRPWQNERSLWDVWSNLRAQIFWSHSDNVHHRVRLFPPIS